MGTGELGVIRSKQVDGIGHYVPTQLYRRRAGRKRGETIE
jgi:hypothetical protein